MTPNIVYSIIMVDKEKENTNMKIYRYKFWPQTNNVTKEEYEVEVFCNLYVKNKEYKDGTISKKRICKMGKIDIFDRYTMYSLDGNKYYEFLELVIEYKKSLMVELQNTLQKHSNDIRELENLRSPK